MLCFACLATLVPLYCAYGVKKLSNLQKNFQLKCSVTGLGSSADLTVAVYEYLRRGSSNVYPFIKDDYLEEGKGVVRVCKNVEFTTDLVRGEGAEEYTAMAQSWSEACATELSEASTSVTKVAMVRQNVVSIQWNVTYVPDALISLVWIARLIPGAKLSFFNVLDKERVRSSFSWVSFRVFLERILYKGVVLLPHAVILGSTELSFREEIGSGGLDSSTVSSGSGSIAEGTSINRGVLSPLLPKIQPNQRIWILTGSKEKINLVRSIDGGLLKNRKLATDLLQFLDARKPATVSLADWNDVLVNRINTRSVPGMGQFDIDGLEGRLCKTVSSSPFQCIFLTTCSNWFYALHPLFCSCATEGIA